MWLLIKNLAFTVLMPGTVAVFVPVVVFAHAPAQASAIATALLLAGGAMLYEEPHLAGVFGPAYRGYCAAVARWLPTCLIVPQPPTGIRQTLNRGTAMPQVETARGPIETGRLGKVLMHEHVFVSRRKFAELSGGSG